MQAFDPGQATWQLVGNMEASFPKLWQPPVHVRGTWLAAALAAPRSPCPVATPPCQHYKQAQEGGVFWTRRCCSGLVLHSCCTFNSAWESFKKSCAGHCRRPILSGQPGAAVCSKGRLSIGGCALFCFFLNVRDFESKQSSVCKACICEQIAPEFACNLSAARRPSCLRCSGGGSRSRGMFHGRSTVQSRFRLALLNIFRAMYTCACNFHIFLDVHT